MKIVIHNDFHVKDISRHINAKCHEVALMVKLLLYQCTT